MAGLRKPRLVRREADELTRRSAHISSVHYDDSILPLDQPEEIQPSSPSIPGRHPGREPAIPERLDHPRANPVILAQGVAQTQDDDGRLPPRRIVIDNARRAAHLARVTHTNSTVRR
jgi:hypothetical protein